MPGQTGVAKMKTRLIYENKVRGGLWFVDYLSSDGNCWKNYGSEKSKSAALDMLERLQNDGY